MNGKIWKAYLNPSSPRYLEWRKIFQQDEIPLINNVAYQAKLGDQRDTIFLLNWFKIVGEESDNLIAYFANKHGLTHTEIEKQFDADGHVPIRTSDVIVAYDLRMFI